MLYRRSLRGNFLYKLSIAMAVLVFITSYSIYIYLRYITTAELENKLYNSASFLLKDYHNLPEILKENTKKLEKKGIKAYLGTVEHYNYQPDFFKIIKDKKSKEYYLKGYFPYSFKDKKYLILQQNITRQINIQNRLYNAIIFINISSLLIIIFYAFIISKMLTRPINIVSKKIANFSQDHIEYIDKKGIPKEFTPLVLSINNLIKKINNYTYYQKELFIGAAHELKTPLAVMKTKSQVALIKKNKTDTTLIDAIEQNIKSINTLNSTVESILAFGRAESAQFQKREKIEFVEFIDNLTKEYEIFAIKEEKFIINKSNTGTLNINIQQSLLRLILQNLLQNALKFTNKGGYVTVKSFICKDNLVIRVKNYGYQIPDNIDIFAPFKRTADSTGTGLGLFLAKNAASTLNAKLSVQNQKKQKGVVASLILAFKFNN